MSNTGTYLLTKNGLEKVSDAVPTLSRPVYFNKGGIPAYDPSARCTFQSKEHKRRWLKENKMREGGLINPDKRLEGLYRNRSKISAEAKQASLARQAWIQSQGGTEGLLNRLQQKRTNV